MKFSLEQKGFSMVEIVIALGLVSIISIVFHTSANSAFQLYRATEKKEQAYSIATGVLDTVISSKNSSFFDLPEGTYYQDSSGNYISGTEQVGNFFNEIKIENLCRESNGEIIDCVGSAIKDSNSKKITVLISWDESGQTGSVELSRHLNNWENI